MFFLSFYFIFSYCILFTFFMGHAAWFKINEMKTNEISVSMVILKTELVSYK